MRGCAIVLAFAALVVGCGQAVTNQGGAGSRPQLSVEPLPAFQQPLRAVVASGDTIEAVCRQMAGPAWVTWRDALLTELDPRDLRPGMEFEGFRSSGGQLVEMQVTLDRRSQLHLRQKEHGITVESTEKPITGTEIHLEGEITSSLFGAVEAAGGRPELAVRMAEIFQWDIDFLRDLRVGDSFVVLVDEQRVDNEFYGYGTIYAARFVNAGRTLEAIAYPDENGRIGYYDLDGRPLRKQFLRSPMKFSRITSRFTMRRFHPVLKRTMPHYGIDYGAPTGTPAHVTADGVVTFAGRKGGAGKMVTVRHPNGYQTNYLHLSRYGKGVRRGARVVQGQVIGYVGSTGLSTGPHLDYRVKLNGKWINPLSISSPAAEPLSETQLRRFLSHAIAVVTVLSGGEVPTGATC